MDISYFDNLWKSDGAGRNYSSGFRDMHADEFNSHTGWMHLQMMLRVLER